MSDKITEKLTPEQLADKMFGHLTTGDFNEFNVDRMVEEIFAAGYKAGFEIGCMKGSMAMQSTLDDDYHFTPLVNHQKLAKVMTKKEAE